MIGGKYQAGEYKLDARFKKDVLANRIRKIASYSEHITVHCEDSLVLLKGCSAWLPRKSLIYLDPPYYLKGKGLYRNFYEHADHLAVAQLLQSRRFKRSWVVSYDSVDEIRAMYDRSRELSYGLNYTAQRRYVGSEVMFFSENLELPESSCAALKLAA